MKTKKCIIIILCLTVLLVFTSSFYSYTKAISIKDIIQSGDDFIDEGKDGQSSTTIPEEDISGITSPLYNILLIIGTIIAAFVGIVLGIQFITGSVEAKSKVKESLIPYFAGCVVIFGAFGIWKLAVILLRNLN